MANPTTNFGWVMPTSASLVTNLPADFNTFGQGVDTSMAQLKGGTTGQILSKTSATDMAFTWITPNPGDITGITATSPLTGGGTSGDVTIGILSGTTSNLGAVQLSTSTSSTSTSLAATASAVKSAYDLADAAIAKSTVTAKGSIVAASASSTPAQLAVGNNGETLVADSSTTTGLRWQPNQTAGKNKILNSDMSIAQRGTSVSVGSASWSTYTLDRYKCYSGNTATTVSQNTSAPTGFSYSLKLQRPNGNTGTNGLLIAQIVETANCMSLQGQYVTLSFWVKKGANYSGGNVGVALLQGTGTDQGGDPYSWTGLTAPINDTSYSPTTSFVRLSYSTTLPSTAKELAVVLSYTPTGTAGADDALYITGVQLEAGAMTSYAPATGTFQGELAACQRYYEISYDGATPAASGTTGFVGSPSMATNTGSNIYRALQIGYKVTKRAVPTVTIYDGAGTSGKITTYSSADLSQTAGVTGTADNIGQQNYRVYWLSTNGGAGWHHAVSAEL